MRLIGERSVARNFISGRGKVPLPTLDAGNDPGASSRHELDAAATFLEPRRVSKTFSLEQPEQFNDFLDSPSPDSHPLAALPASNLNIEKDGALIHTKGADNTKGKHHANS